jgi:hypothetical protein
MRRPSSAGLSVVVAAILCALAIAAAVTSAWWVFKEPEHTAGKAWFYDLNKNELFVGPGDGIPPIEAPSGPMSNGSDAGVQAVVLDDNGTNRVAYLFTYPPETKKLLEGLKTGDMQDVPPSAPPIRWVRAAEGGDWFSEVTEQGGKIMNDSLKSVGNGVTYSIPK